MLGFLRNMKTFCSEIQSYWVRDILHVIESGIFFMLLSQGYSSCYWVRDILHVIESGIFFMLLSQGYSSCYWVRDILHRNFKLLFGILMMMGATCGTGNTHFPEHLISLLLGSSWFHILKIYTLPNMSVLGQCLRINDWLACLDLISDLFYCTVMGVVYLV